MNQQTANFLRQAVELIQETQAAQTKLNDAFERRLRSAEGHSAALELAVCALIETHPQPHQLAEHWRSTLMHAADIAVDFAGDSPAAAASFPSMHEALGRLSRAIQAASKQSDAP